MKKLLTLSKIISSGYRDILRSTLVATRMNTQSQEIDFPVVFLLNPQWPVSKYPRENLSRVNLLD